MERKCVRWLGGLISRFWFLAAWIILNMLIFLKTYSDYNKGLQYAYLRKILGHGLCFSRASAAILNLSCCMVLLPVCQRVNSAILRLLGKTSPSLVMWWLEKAKMFHIICAVTTVLAAGIHTVAHLVNVMHFSSHYNHDYRDINWAKYESQNPLEIIFTSVAGITGIAMVVILIALTTTSLSCIRQSHYNVFWMVHHCSLLLFFLLLGHPLSGILKKQVNVEKHVPGCHQNLTTELQHEMYHKNISFSETYCSMPPVFLPIKSQGWKWIIFPFTLYIIDLVWRIIERNKHEVCVVETRRLPAHAVQLKLLYQKKKFTCHPGQYILLQCPAIAAFQWHPYTLTSCPSTSFPYLTIIMKARGDWSGEVCGNVLTPFHHYESKKELFEENHSPFLRLLMDGPYRTPMEKVIHSEVAICIAAGVGITAFAASLHHLLNHSAKNSMPYNVRLVWITNNVCELMWFRSLFCSLHEKFWNSNQPDRFEICLQVTRNFDRNYCQRLFSKDYIFLSQRIKSGRPNWKKLFSEWKSIYKRKKVNVFICGPKPLAEEIRNMCNEFNNNGSSFHLTYEPFS